jgi:hypothetical protein
MSQIIRRAALAVAGLLVAAFAAACSAGGGTVPVA